MGVIFFLVADTHITLLDAKLGDPWESRFSDPHGAVEAF